MFIACVMSNFGVEMKDLKLKRETVKTVAHKGIEIRENYRDELIGKNLALHLDGS